ncbi:MAG: DUF1996 domain-containing protein [bacterium]|nr:DUF1996 domain-containing protein [bacterium]
MKQFQQIEILAEKFRSHQHFSKAVAFMAIFATLGVYMAIVAFAAAQQSVRLGIDNAVLTNGAKQVADSDASGGQAILFSSGGGQGGGHGGGHGGGSGGGSGGNSTATPGSSGCATGPLISIGICLDQSTVPNAVLGYSTPRRVQEQNYGPVYTDGVGAFRTECTLSHTSKNDPIVYPGQKNAAHWHQFFGNTAVDEKMTNPATQGNSTCNGGTLNKTAYWAPALIDTNSYDPATKTFDLVPVMTLQDSPNPGFSPGGNAMQVYYKAGYNGVSSTNIEWFPPGLKIIAGGNPNVAPTGPPSVSSPAGIRTVVFDCIAWGHAQSVWGTQGVDYDTDRIPANCPPGYYIQGKIIFPQCGANNPDGSPMLDSANHRSHMAYPLGWPDKGCPASHPREYPEILEHFRWRVPATGAGGLRFSSDTYSSGQPGWTFHADWWNGWNPATAQTILTRCYHSGISGSAPGTDCRIDLTGEPHPNGGWWRLD